ncbi:hypothetical protein CHUAL_010707 [Chamberlinius hualienensis]
MANKGQEQTTFVDVNQLQQALATKLHTGAAVDDDSSSSEQEVDSDLDFNASEAHGNISSDYSRVRRGKPATTGANLEKFNARSSDSHRDGLARVKSTTSSGSNDFKSKSDGRCDQKAQRDQREKKQWPKDHEYPDLPQRDNKFNCNNCGNPG